jgi:hypothetical protein
MVTFSRLLQLLKAMSPISVTLSGMVTLFKEGQLLKAYSPMLVTPYGISI